MTETEQPDWMMGITKIVRDPLRFKLKLDIGEDVYASIRMKKYFLQAVDASGGVVTGVGVAKSSVVASTFFAPSGFLGAIGLGAAATPVGWAIAAGIVGAGLSVSLGKYFIRGSSSRVREIPDFINTPLDILALGLFDSIAMLSVKVATIDGEFADSERLLIKRYFGDEWGYDHEFIEAGLSEIERSSDEHTIKNDQRNPDTEAGFGGTATSDGFEDPTGVTDVSTAFAGKEWFRLGFVVNNSSGTNFGGGRVAGSATLIPRSG